MKQNTAAQNSSKSIWIKRMRKFHKWPGIVLTFFVVLFALSGIVMNHRNWFSSVDVPRSILPPDYKIKNWNLASVRGSVDVSPEDMVIYGNIGVWLTNHRMEKFIDLNQGFPKGIDNRKIESMLLTSSGELIVGTLFGLYQYDGESWQNIKLPVKEYRIADIMEREGTIHILTRSTLLLTKNLQEFEAIQLPVALTDDNKISLFKTLWTLHSGEMFGITGKILVDILALGLIFLAVTGILHWLFPKWIKRRKQKSKQIQEIKNAMRSNMKLHNKFGYILAAFLLFTAITGIFLRPPLLIPIASVKVSKIPYSKLDDPNPWHDKLRRIAWDDTNNKYLIYSSDGFFWFDQAFNTPAISVPVQPPVSVMGCTVLKPHIVLPDTWVVGSFSGLFHWNIKTGAIENAITGAGYVQPARPASPVSDNLISGFIRTPKDEYIVDYNRGIELFSGNTPAPDMPQAIEEKTPMSLWNVALEVHTGRIFNHLFGIFYIFYIPLAGITLIIVLISGFVIWWLAHRKRKKKNADTDLCL